MTRLLLLAALGVSACTTAHVPAQPVAPSGLSLTSDQTAYARGATAHLTLRNGATVAAQTGVLACAQIETWTGGVWALNPVGNDRACILMLVSVAPGEAITGDVPLGVPAGTYRLVQSVSFEGSEVAETVATAAFRVDG